MPAMLLPEHSYVLKAEGIKGIVFNEISPLLSLVSGGPRIYIESDRWIYKPGDVVQFRVIILDEHLRPVNIFEPIRVQIMDADQNRVQQYKDIKLKRGVFAAKFDLSKQPILGDWKIVVFISGKYNQHKEYIFKVQEYVLPKFSVHIETDGDYVGNDGMLKLTVFGKYTYGKNVEGTVELDVLNENRRSYGVERTMDITNSDIGAKMTINATTLMHNKKLIVCAKLTERLTNVTATAETVVKVRQQNYIIIVPESEIELRNNRPYRLKVHVEHWNGTRVRDVTTPVIMQLFTTRYKSYLDIEGTAQFEFEYDPNSDFEFEYKGSSSTFNNIFTPQERNAYKFEMCHLQRKAKSSSDSNSAIVIEVSSNDTMPYIFYTITSHGNIVQGEYIRLQNNQKSHTIMLNTSIDIIPESFMYVHYIVNGHMHYCELKITLTETFENEISISAPAMVRPGQEITLNVKGQPNSHVSIVAVDKSVLLLGTTNLLKKSEIMWELKSDRSHRAGGTMEYYPGDISGVITLTNAKFEMDSSLFGRLPVYDSHKDTPRSIFPETWIFEDMEIDRDITPLKVTVPDTITTWIIRAFSVNDRMGFGMMETSMDIVAYKPFFVSTNLPYSVKRGEVVTIPLTVFNYLDQNYQTEVIMDNSKAEFNFADDQNRPLNLTTDSRKIIVPANNGKSVSFVIIAKKVGNIDIRISATNTNMSDVILQKLKVEPEGIRRQYNSDASLKLIQGKSQKTPFRPPTPTNVVPESEYVTLSVSGDVLGSTLENLDDLVQKPTGCGEQNMINLAPNILVLDYLKTIDKYNESTKLALKAQRFIETGYQQQLTYRHPEGGYSVFGPKSISAESNWLTAYVTRFFIKAIQYSAIEERIIQSGLDFLAKQQASDGSFPQRGYLFDPAHQNQFGFTAFVLLSFLEDEDYAQKYSKCIDNAMAFLTNNLNNVNDVYSLAIMANVFQKTESSHTNDIISKLKSKARQENDLMWWTNNEANKESANDVEITAYALMALLEVSGQYTSIFNWLLKQRNSHGGFDSTHDTVVGLQALIKYAEKFGSVDTKLKVHYVAKNEEGANVKEHFLGVDADNSIILQKQELPPTTRSVEVEVMGHGKIFLQFTYEYYMSLDKLQSSSDTSAGRTTTPSNNDESLMDNKKLSSTLPLIQAHQYFAIAPIAKLSPLSNSLTLSICCSYQPLQPTDASTTMVILQVQLPSGFVANSENMKKLKKTKDQISRVEPLKSSTMLEIYFESLKPKEEQCLTIKSDRMQEVESLKSSTIKMYEYYNPQINSEILYDINK